MPRPQGRQDALSGAADQPMFARHVTSVGSSFLPAWRSFYRPRHHLLTLAPPCPPTCSRHQLAGWTPRAAPGQFASGLAPWSPRFSSGAMNSDREPPPKRRKSSENQRRAPRDSSAHSSPARSPRRSSSSPEDAGRSSEIRREWEDLSHRYGHTLPAFDFSVMSYNILSQQLLRDNAYLYQHCRGGVLDWRHRFPNIIRELEQHSPDIMCLQEVQEDHYQDQIKPALESLGYHCEYKRRTGKKPDGCAVVFRRDRFTLVSCHPVEYYRRGVPLMDRDNVGLVALLEPVAPPGAAAARVCVANTHLLYNPRRGDIKLAQLGVLLAEVGRVARLADGSTCPVVLCGDFNSVPGSPLYSFIRERRLDYGGMAIGKVSGQEDSPRGQRLLNVPIWPPSLGVSQQCQYEERPSETNESESDVPAKAATHGPQIEHGLNLASVYSHYLKDGRKKEITTCHSKTAITVDYIFYSPAAGDVSVQSGRGAACDRGLLLLARLALVDEAVLQAANGLPTEHNSSDHLPLVARFRLQR
ncbi:protein angel homolog 2 isoform X1 [Denticeps clupeoides]|uniref:Endonuclease/exonuclease/phosphatase domain-containing protein n=2 Tax=Denticeps clupeoides TaxID=299321 RepID=A0AAY4AYA6_9TELE|nr:protein angel homolog 2 isoform X1 [Denticeps clupeoides]XP_028809035.1 protein angel homolog 2 isoform X1 [Denticeps clupeoides]XP_028809037.1 protein angel homolog 2 isoform X1 [Denticeps clupeoides]